MYTVFYIYDLHCDGTRQRKIRIPIEITSLKTSTKAIIDINEDNRLEEYQKYLVEMLPVLRGVAREGAAWPRPPPKLFWGGPKYHLAPPKRPWVHIFNSTRITMNYSKK